jgi:hypothetical protein
MKQEHKMAMMEYAFTFGKDEKIAQILDWVRDYKARVNIKTGDTTFFGNPMYAVSIRCDRSNASFIAEGAFICEKIASMNSHCRKLTGSVFMPFFSFQNVKTTADLQDNTIRDMLDGFEDVCKEAGIAVAA